MDRFTEGFFKTAGVSNSTLIKAIAKRYKSRGEQSLIKSKKDLTKYIESKNYKQTMDHRMRRKKDGFLGHNKNPETGVSGAAANNNTQQDLVGYMQRMRPNPNKGVKKK